MTSEGSRATIKCVDNNSSWVTRILNPILSSLITLAAIAYSLDLFRAIGLTLFTEQFLLGMLGLSLLTIFVRIPANPKQKRGVGTWLESQKPN